MPKKNKPKARDILVEIQWCGPGETCPVCRATRYSCGVEQVAHYEGCRLAHAANIPTDD